MDRQNLVEIKKGQTGTGLLIEHDGFISSECGNNKKLFEAINAENASGDEFHCPYPFRTQTEEFILRKSLRGK